MCRHCERLVEDVEQRPLVHAFMEETAKRLSKRAGCRIAPDDINIRFEVTVRNAAMQLLKSMNDGEWTL